MPFLKTYRGEFSNTLPGVDNAAVDQVIRVDINQGSATAPTTITGSLLFLGGFELSIAPPLLSPARPLAERTAFWQTYNDFFYVGMTVRVTGTPSDGDYVVLTKTLFPPTNAFSDDPGSITMTVNIDPPVHTLGQEDVLYEDVTPATIIPLKMAGDPLHIATIDNSEDKFTTIRAKQAVITIHTDEVIDINTFAEADDGSFYVEIFIDTLIIFKGFLIIPDMEQEFMPNPNELVLIAVDNLGTLKDIDLVDEDGLTPTANNQIIKYIAWSLRQTGLLLPINVINSVRHGYGGVTITVSFTYSGDNTVITVSSADAANFHIGELITITGSVSNNVTVTVTGIEAIDPFITKIVTNGTFTTEGPVAITLTDATSLLPFYEAIYLDAKTFEKDIAVCENCYTVLKKIFGEDSVLFQQNGEWYIVRIDDMQGDGTYSVDRFDFDGVFIETVTIDRNKNIGKPDVIQFMNDDPIVIPDRGYKKITETFRYETPIEIICNIDFSDGNFIADLTPTAQEIAEGAVYAKSFELDNWTMYRGWPGSPIANDSTDYIYKLYNVVDYESARFAVITAPTSANVLAPYIVSCDLPVNKLDRFESSVNYKMAANQTSGGGFFHLMVFVVHGNDDSWWILGRNPNVDGEGTDLAKWWDTSNWTVFTGKGEVGLNFSIGTDYSQFQSLSYDFKDVPPVPVAGKLQIWLFGLNIGGGSPANTDIHYSGLSFTYYPFINGSYKKYTGQSHNISQDGGYRAARDEQVYISDAPALLLKGGFRYFNGIDYLLTIAFTDANHTTPRPYGELQAYAVWNQYRNSNRNFDGELDLMESDVTDGGLYDGADLLHKYKLTDSNVNTNNRLFMVLHYDMDFNLLEWKSFVASLYRTDLGKVYTDDHVFKYISS